MKAIIRCFFFVFLLALPAVAMAAISAGVGKTFITPPVGTPSAGYSERKGQGMEGVHDPLLAIALFIDNGEKQILFCSVDHLGFTYEMVQEITQKIHAHPALERCEIFIGSSHTHSGGGAYLNIPMLGASLAGKYDPQMTQFYIDKTSDAIFQAYEQRTPAKIGVGYGEAPPLSQYRGLWPKEITPLNGVTLIKVTHLDGTPLAALFNYPVHPTLLRSQNRLFSADFVGYARDHLQATIGSTLQPIYFNGAQGDINPRVLHEENRFDACDRLAASLAATVQTIWETTETSDTLQISTQKASYAFKPEPNPFGVSLPLDLYKSEMNLIVLNKLDAFITMPGELSCLYDKSLKAISHKLGFTHLSILGLTNDAHGYIILPESWRHKTFESHLSFGGENYGAIMEKRAQDLLTNHMTHLSKGPHLIDSTSENHGLSLLSDQDKMIYSVGISTGGIAEMRMARALPHRQIVATTLDPEGARFTQEWIERAALPDQIEVKIEDVAQPLPYEDRSFDFVYARLVLHYLSYPDLRNALQELHRILKPMGRIFVVVRSSACLEAQKGVYNEETGMTTYTLSDGKSYGRYFHSENSISDFLKNAGFHITHVKSYEEQLCLDFQRTQISPDLDNLIEIYASK